MKIHHEVSALPRERREELIRIQSARIEEEEGRLYPQRWRTESERDVPRRNGSAVALISNRGDRVQSIRDLSRLSGLLPHRVKRWLRDGRMIMCRRWTPERATTKLPAATAASANAAAMGSDGHRHGKTRRGASACEPEEKP